jgi:sigma-B regulation protein RsbU (phosphoserine phosphatase)
MLTRTRWALLGYLQELGTGDDTIADVILALDEACANVVRHAFPTGDGSFRLAAELTENEVLLEVEDDGVGFDALELSTRPIPADALAGRGLGIIQQLMTSVELESPIERGGTRLRMRKRLDAAGAEGTTLT